jgi:hypothetical protein
LIIIKYFLLVIKINDVILFKLFRYHVLNHFFSLKNHIQQFVTLITKLLFNGKIYIRLIYTFIKFIIQLVVIMNKKGYNEEYLSNTTKKNYYTPQLIVHGELSEITKGIPTPGEADNYTGCSE